MGIWWPAQTTKCCIQISNKVPKLSSHWQQSSWNYPFQSQPRPRLMHLIPFYKYASSIMQYQAEVKNTPLITKLSYACSHRVNKQISICQFFYPEPKIEGDVLQNFIMVKKCFLEDNHFLISRYSTPPLLTWSSWLPSPFYFLDEAGPSVCQ